MGGSNWSDRLYSARATLRATENKPTFAYDQQTKAKPVHEQKVHPSLDPKGVKVRESRDSAEHPESKAVVVLLDQTGSLNAVPAIVQSALPKLMGLLIRKGYLPHPHIMIAAMGDCNSDRAVLQVGQFEAGIEIENDLTNLWLEGNGGGQKCESYELATYFLAKHTAIDCFEKRGQKGYVFIIGDEMSYPAARREQVEAIIGDKLEADLPFPALLKELEERYEVFFVIPKLAAYYDDKQVFEFWRELLGERVLKLAEPDGICELIAGTIALVEGAGTVDSLQTDMQDAGTSSGTALAVSRALSTVTPGTAGAIATLPSSGTGTDLETL